MENRFSVGMAFGALLSIPLWMAVIGWLRWLAQWGTLVLHGWAG
ncbi:hypothetical protein SAMN02799630_04324 [Paenibacillus sp. UNCCL117]|nr:MULTISPECIES: hypothetical protein [unclassified Paenibacillus]SDD97460.1 hypothetical protein SAMN04488602_11670 [Paenibacillus sp. cl123]SFW56190.1 hypothetical protein SAMN02799630_04324 [Paenibacillus sp. UNCCL117]